MWLPVLAPLVLMAAAPFAAHIPGVATVIDGNPDGPPPHDNGTPPCPLHGWTCLLEDYRPHPLPAVERDRTYLSAWDARRAYDNRIQQGGTQ